MYRIVLLLMMLTAFAAALLAAYGRGRGWSGCPDWPTCFGQWPWDDPALLLEQAQRFTVDEASLWCDEVLRCLELLLVIEWLLLLIGAFRQPAPRWPALTSAVALLALILTALAFDRWDSELPGIIWLQAGHGLVLAVLLWSCGGLFWYSQRFADLATPRGPTRLTAWVMGAWCVQTVWGLILGAQSVSAECQLFVLCPNASLAARLQSLGLDIDPAYGIHLALTVVVLGLTGCLIMRLLPPRQPTGLRIAGGLLLLWLALQGLSGFIETGDDRVAGVLIHHALALTAMLLLIWVRYTASHESELLPVRQLEEASTTAVATIAAAPVLGPALEAYVPASPENLFRRLTVQLQRTRSGLHALWQQWASGDVAVPDLLQEIEDRLIMADAGVDTAAYLIERLRARVDGPSLVSGEACLGALKAELLELLTPCEKPLQIDAACRPYVILVVGVNGVGKTTTIGKLAKRLQSQGHSVMLAAGDTFRAAAVEQLQTWGERNQIPVVAQHTGADSASVIFDAFQSARAKGIDVLIADTAGRLHTKSHLMEELKKIKRIIGKLDESAPHEVLLVVDAGTGQNVLSQAKLFDEAVGLTGMALTKLDGTAKGGIIFALARHMTVPIRYIGVGEGIDDLQDFHAQAFIEALFASEPPA